MVCPYCNTRSAPNQPVCNHCGVILRDIKSSKRPRKPFPWRRVLLRVISYIVAGLLAAILGRIAAQFLYEGNPKAEVGGAASGLAVGVLLVFLVSRGSFLIQTTLLHNQRRAVHGRAQKIERDREKLVEDQQKLLKENPKAPVNPESRMELAAMHLIEGQVDESLQQLEQAYKLGIGPRVDFLNNVGVAFAQRGQLQLSLDRFNQAIKQDPSASEPRFNLVYSLMRTGDGEKMRDVIAQQNGNLSSAAASSSAASRMGLTYALTGKTAEAIQYIEQVVKQGEKDTLADAHNDLGVAKATAKNYKEATDEFQSALKIDSGHAPALANIGAIYYNQHRYETAVERLGAALIVDPHHGQVHNLLGASYCQLRMYNDGIREFREARTHQANLFEPNYNLGKIYIEQDVADQAEKFLARAYEINPYSWQTLVAQAVLLFKLNQVERALTLYHQALDVRPAETSILGGLGLCYTLTGEYQKAAHYFTQGLSIGKDDIDMMTNFSWHYLIQSNVEEAVKLLEKVVQIDRKAAVANSNMGLCQMDLGAPDAAMSYFKTALQTDPSLSTVYYNMGNNYIGQKAIINAIDSWEKAKKVETGNADLHTNLGVAYYRQEDYEKSSVEFRRVLMLRQERVEDYANLGIVFARLKRHKEAIEQFEHGIELDPQNAMLHSNLGLAFYFANKVEEAMHEWREVTQVNAAYARQRGTKLQKEFDDASIDYVPIYISERALYTKPKIPDYIAPYVPGYRTSRYDLIVNSEDLTQLETLKDQEAKIDRTIRALKL